MINDFGYMFEMINGIDPGKIMDNSGITELTKVFSVEDTISSQIAADIEVFGWHPHWMKSKWEDYPFNLLSTISYFSYNIDPATGNPLNPNELDIWNNSDFVKTAKNKKNKSFINYCITW